MSSVLLLSVGLALRLGLGIRGQDPDPSAICLAAAAAHAATALLPFPYLWRALLWIGISVGLFVLGLSTATGPLGLLATPTRMGRAIEVARVVWVTMLSATLLFRAHYRAYALGKKLFAVGFTVALPFLVCQGIATFEAPHLVARLGPSLALIAGFWAFFAFLAPPTRTATAWCVAFILLGTGLDIGLRHGYVPIPAGAGPWAHELGSLAFVGAAGPLAIGLFQVLSAAFATDARRVDVHQLPEDRRSQPPPESRL